MAVARGGIFATVQSRLVDSPVLPIFVEYFQSSTSDQPLSESYPQLLAALIDRHANVSTNKNRQRWCYLDGDKVIRDDLQPMNLAMHAIRFPQVYALCKDIALHRSDLSNVV